MCLAEVSAKESIKTAKCDQELRPYGTCTPIYLVDYKVKLCTGRAAPTAFVELVRGSGLYGENTKILVSMFSAQISRPCHDGVESRN